MRCAADEALHREQMLSFKQLDIGRFDVHFVNFGRCEPAALHYFVICSGLRARFDRQLIEVVLLACEHVVIEEPGPVEG